jgi:DNA-binding HxlR family transcriptional regulator
MRKRIAKYFHCPTEFTLAVLDGKWKTVILSYLKERPCRYTELRRLVPSLSDKMLTERLHDLTRAGLVVRRPVGISSLTQRYALTQKGSSLNAVLQHLYAWGVENADLFGVRVGQPLQELDAAGTASVRSRVVRRALGAQDLGRTRPRHSGRGPVQ